jgi:hypothetical protein
LVNVQEDGVVLAHFERVQVSHLVVLPLRSISEVLFLIALVNRALVVEDEVNLRAAR